MKIDRRLFIGYDSNQSEAYSVCRQSLIDVGVDPLIIQPIKKHDLEADGLYWRKDENGSTDFTNTRFLVPYLSGYYGTSLFCDCDFLWRKNPEELFDIVENSHSHVHVVKHDIKPEQLQSEKMYGQTQSWYEKKNWSSMMVFKNENCVRLTPKVVSEAHPLWLHQFDWTHKLMIRSLPLEYNYLVGYGYDVEDPVAVHFTDGGPWIDKYRDVEFSQEWFGVQQRIKR